MKTIDPIATASVAARALFARPWANGWLVEVDDDGVLVLDRDLTIRDHHPRAGDVTDAALDREGVLLTLADCSSLRALDLRAGRERWSCAGTFHACRHAGDGRGLWAIESRADGFELTLRDPRTGAIRRAAEVPDVFGDADASLQAHPDPRGIVVWVAAGQDGQATYVAFDRGDAIDVVELGPRDHLPPVFAPAGDSYLIADDQTLELRAWPSGEELADLPWSGTEGDEPLDEIEDQAGADVMFLPGGFATWSSTNGRLYLIDLTTMSVADELVIAGHALQSVEELYPSLVGDLTPCSDFEYAARGGDLVLTVHAEAELAVTRLADWSPDPERS